MKFHKAGKKPAKKPAKVATKKGKRRVRHNPAPSSQRRHYGKRRVRRNPAGLDFKDFGIQVATVGGGALGALYLNNFAAQWLPARFRGLASILAGAGAMMFVRSPVVERMALGAAAMGLVDILRSNVPALVPMSAEDAGYLLGAASVHDADLSNLLGMDNSNVPDVLGFDTGSIPLGMDNSNVPDVLGFDTGSIPLGDEEGDGLFEDDDDGL